MRDPNHVHNPRLKPRVCYMKGCNEVACIDANRDYQNEYRASDAAAARKRNREVREARERAQDLREQAALASE